MGYYKIEFPGPLQNRNRKPVPAWANYCEPKAANLVYLSAKFFRSPRANTSNPATSTAPPTSAAAIKTTAAVKIVNRDDAVDSAGKKDCAAYEMPIVAAITAIPPPCGVGALCDERGLGRANA